MRDAGCGMRDASRPVATEFADETDGHGDHAVAQVYDCVNVIGGHELESREYGEVTVQFGVGSQRDLESAEELRRSPQRIALRNVCRYREGCATDLVNEREMPAKLRAQGKQVRLVGELLSTAPSVETLELPHVREHVVGGRQRRYPIPACWCGFHASRIPCLNPRSSRGAVRGGVASPSPPACARPASKTSSVRSTCSGPAKPWVS